MEKAIYKLNFNGPDNQLVSIFIAENNLVQKLLQKQPVIYMMLHDAGIEGTILENEIKKLTDDPVIVSFFEQNNIVHGFDIFQAEVTMPGIKPGTKLIEYLNQQ